MNKPAGSKPPPISYADGPRLQRAVQSLPYEAQVKLLKAYNSHLSTPLIESVQRRGHLLYVNLAGSKKASTDVYDFGAETHAQRCLAALTDCLRSNGAAVKVLMPEPPPAP